MIEECGRRDQLYTAIRSPKRVRKGELRDTHPSRIYVLTLFSTPALCARYRLARIRFFRVRPPTMRANANGASRPPFIIRLAYTGAVPQGIRFTLKKSRRRTHVSRKR